MELVYFVGTPTNSDLHKNLKIIKSTLLKESTDVSAMLPSLGYKTINTMGIVLYPEEGSIAETSVDSFNSVDFIIFKFH